MLIKDKIYGNFQITSPVVIELIQSPTIQRLKKISQVGVPNEYYHIKGDSRFNHSLGDYLLLNKVKASEEEQIAGLLHDISHTAFSHIVDWVLGSGEREDFQDNQHEEFFLNSEIKDILLKYNYNPKKLCQNKKYTLLDNEIPNVCADRFDYSLREFPLKIAHQCLQGVLNINNQLVFKDRKSAQLFATQFLKRQLVHWGSYEAGTRYILFSTALQIALKKKIIQFKEFMTTEDVIMNKLLKTKDKKIQLILKTLQQKKLSHLPLSKKIYRKKFRFVDPYFISNNKLVRLSHVDQKFKKLIDQSNIENKKGIRAGTIFN